MKPTDHVLNALSCGLTSANAVRHATGLQHEAVYHALAWLEARGLAVLTCRKASNGNITTEWGAA
jgi:hypothetical protein